MSEHSYETKFRAAGSDHSAVMLGRRPDIESMREQGYTIETITEIVPCAKCDGRGARFVRPRGRRGNVPLYMCRREPCTACGETGVAARIDVTEQETRSRAVKS